VDVVGGEGAGEEKEVEKKSGGIGGGVEGAGGTRG